MVRILKFWMSLALSPLRIIMATRTEVAPSIPNAIGDASRPGELVRIGGGWSIVSYARSYALAAHRLAGEGELAPIAMPLFFLIRHSVELALKDILRLIDAGRRDDQTLDEYDAAGKRAVKSWAKGDPAAKLALERGEQGLLSPEEAALLSTEAQARYAKHGRKAANRYLSPRKSTLSREATAALNGHKLVPLLDALCFHRTGIPETWRELVLAVEAFERGYPDRARFESVGEPRTSSLPGFLQEPVQIPLQNLLRQLDRFIRESVDTDIDQESVMVELYYEGQSASNRLHDLDL